VDAPARQRHGNQVLPIGRWENIRKEDGKLMADPVFDEQDKFAQLVKSKVENGFVKGASIGVRIKNVSDEKNHLLAGQSRATVTECEIYEASIVDIPSNRKTVQLFSQEETQEEIPLITNNLIEMAEETTQKPAAETEVLSSEQKTGLVAWLKETFGLSPKQPETVAAAPAPDPNPELIARVETLASEKQAMETELAELKAQVEALKKAPGDVDHKIASETDAAPVTGQSGFLSAETIELYKKLKQ